ncbi:hypothetical protein O1611_g4531 [Lasiodiplodia mahajangana]|uniref:Uncharacterized protein n=1 Tax=Lasiodiplodia mahajangana TaxID=1108764 RepID=A0ACC2JPB2_9PEZI|nr:hypothetical protein O1611_g4531 [Lasiodiplodia mahajangana]
MSGNAVDSGSSTGGNTAKPPNPPTTLSSMYSFYHRNRESLESVPYSVSHGRIPLIFVTRTVRSAEEGKKKLRDLLDTRKIIEDISDWELELMTEVRRKGGS